MLTTENRTDCLDNVGSSTSHNPTALHDHGRGMFLRDAGTRPQCQNPKYHILEKYSNFSFFLDNRLACGMSARCSVVVKAEK
jgi:hypothetical protein